MEGGDRPQAYVFNPVEWVDPLGLAGANHKEQAQKLGYSKAKERSHGQAVYVNKKASRDVKYITPDVDKHNGGYWKAADSVKNLGSRRTRSGTYDADLNRIGD